MTSQISATWMNGTFIPDSAVTLTDQAHVRLTIEPMTASVKPQEAAWESLKARLRERPINSGGEHYTRDELHECR